MFLKPVRRYLLLEELQKDDTVGEEEKKSNIAIPPNQRKKRQGSEEYKFYKVVDAAVDCDIKVAKGKIVLADASMVEIIVDPDGHVSLMILENYVKGIWFEGER